LDTGIEANAAGIGIPASGVEKGPKQHTGMSLVPYGKQMLTNFCFVFLYSRTVGW
jgi:hypothetical protein